MAFKICLPIFFTDSEHLDELSRNSSFEGFSTSFSKNVYPDYDTNSNIEEVSRHNSNERRERNLNKLTRTLGAHPLKIIEDYHITRSPIFDNFSTTGENLIGPMSHHPWDSFESNVLESDTLSSPITFAPSPFEKTSDILPTPRTSSDVDSSFTSTSSTKDDSVQSHSESSLEPEPSSSHMPQLHVSTHSDAVSVPYDVSSDLNGPVAKSDWLVPLDEVVISIRRTAPSKPQSWTGEWNREMEDVIRDLRRL